MAAQNAPAHRSSGPSERPTQAVGSDNNSRRGRPGSSSSSSYIARYRATGQSLVGASLTLDDLQAEAFYLAQHPELNLPSISKAQGRSKPVNVILQGASMWSLTPSLSSLGGNNSAAPPAADNSWTSTLYSMGDLIKGYIPTYIPFLSSVTGSEPGTPSSAATASAAAMQQRRGYWGRTPDDLIADSGGQVPSVFAELRRVILDQCVMTEGIFRRSSNSSLLPSIIATLDVPIADQPAVPWPDIAAQDPLLPPKIILRLCSQMVEPLVKHNLYAVVRHVTDVGSLRSTFLAALPSATRSILDHIIGTLHAVSQHEITTRMSPLSLAIVFAPTLISGPDPLEDAAMCLAPGKQLPAGMMAPQAAAKNDQGGNTLVGVLALWIQHYPDISER